MAVLIGAMQVQAGSTALENAEPNSTDASKQEVEEPLGLENPGSIAERLKRDEEPKDYLFQFPGAAGALKPWYDLKADLDEKHGFTFGISFTPFVRYGYVNQSDNGPTPVKHMANAGMAIDGIFGQANDRIGVGCAWTDPANHELDDQNQIDTYDRVQVMPEIQVGPTFQVIFDPVRNPEEDTVYVWGIRTRIKL